MKHLTFILSAILICMLPACSGAGDKKNETQQAQPTTAAACHKAAEAIAKDHSDSNLSSGVDALAKALAELRDVDNEELLTAAATLMQALDINEGYMSEATAKKYWDMRQNMKYDERGTAVITAVEQATLTLGMSDEDIRHMSEAIDIEAPEDISGIDVEDAAAAIDDPTAQQAAE